MAASKKQTGRPRTTLAKLPKTWRKQMLAIAADGGSQTEARVALGIGTSAWYTLTEDSAEFREAVKEAEAISAVWWEKSGRKLAIEGGGNSAIWIFNMKNRFGWRDKPEDGDREDEPAPVSVSVGVVSGRKSDA